MDITKRTIKELKVAKEWGTEEFRLACAQDKRVCVRRLAIRMVQEAIEKRRVEELYQCELQAEAQGAQCVAGVDEAGRGPWAGPVVVAAVILPPHYFLAGLNDSKKLSPKQREKLFGKIMTSAIAVAITAADATTIDRMNIQQATLHAMREAVLRLKPKADMALIDGISAPQLPIPCQTVVHGDARVASIAAASIVAKVVRDMYMEDFDKLYPGYGFAKHKGYGTSEHMRALQKLGPCAIHRHSFNPMRSLYFAHEKC